MNESLMFEVVSNLPRFNREEVALKVSDILVNSLGVDEDAIVATARIKGDLGAESIDFLDISYRLERSFQIIVPKDATPFQKSNDVWQAELEQAAKETGYDFKDLPELAQNHLKEKHPQDIDPTVSILVDYVQSVLKEQNRFTTFG